MSLFISERRQALIYHTQIFSFDASSSRNDAVAEPSGSKCAIRELRAGDGEGQFGER